MKARSIQGNSPRQMEPVLAAGGSHIFTPTPGNESTLDKQDRTAECEQLTVENIALYGAVTNNRLTGNGTKSYSSTSSLVTANTAIGIEIATNVPPQPQSAANSPVMQGGLTISQENDLSICNGSVSLVSKLRLSVPTYSEVIQTRLAESAQLKPSHLPAAEALTVFRCAGRQAYGPMRGEETERMNNSL